MVGEGHGPASLLLALDSLVSIKYTLKCPVVHSGGVWLVISRVPGVQASHLLVTEVGQFGLRSCDGLLGKAISLLGGLSLEVVQKLKLWL